MRNSQSQSQKRNEGAASERNACPWRVGLSPRFIVPERPCMPSPPYTHSHTHHPLSLSYSPLHFISSLSHTHILSPFSVSLSRAKFPFSFFSSIDQWRLLRRPAPFRRLFTSATSTPTSPTPSW